MAVDLDSDIDSKTQDLTYALGFVTGRDLRWIPTNFMHVPIAVPLYVHPSTRVAVSRAGDGDEIAVIGQAIHPDQPDLDANGVANLLARSGENLQDEIDKLAGRFAIVSGKSNDCFSIQMDAIGMRSVFFSESGGRTVAASHAKLADRACHGENSTIAGMPFKWGYAGMRTQYPGTLRLPPNSALDLAGGSIRRFFPLGPIEPCTPEVCWDFAFAQAHNVVAGAIKRKPVLLSLTAGLDSRTSLAATRGLWRDLTFFTYERRDAPALQVDVMVAAGIARRLGLHHIKLDCTGPTPNPVLLTAIRANSFLSHGHNLACLYHQEFGSQKYIHVRTNLLELARSNLYGYHDSKPEFHGGPTTAQRMADFYKCAGSLAFDDRYLAAFDEYVAVTGFNEALSFAEAWDLFFVEHRMGAWHAGIVAESDIAFDTIVAFNSRNIVKRIMGVPQPIRSSANVLRERLSMLLPEIADIPINPKVYSGMSPNRRQQSAT